MYLYKYMRASDGSGGGESYHACRNVVAGTNRPFGCGLADIGSTYCLIIYACIILLYVCCTAYIPLLFCFV